MFESNLADQASRSEVIEQISGDYFQSDWITDPASSAASSVPA